MDRPALQRLLADIQDRKVDVVVVYKVDRLTRSLADFAKMVEIFDARGVSFVSVTQQFNTTSSMGRLTLNVLLSFAQFDLSPFSHPAPRRVRSSFEPFRLGGATGWGAKPPSARSDPPRCITGSPSLAKSAGGTLPIALCGLTVL
jgi:hypothetical protein